MSASAVAETTDLVIERVFDAPRERVFDVFTKAEHVQKWWGPKMVGNPIAEFEARPGGTFFISERHADGTMLYLAGLVREIERPSRFVLAFHYATETRERVSPPVRSGLPTTCGVEFATPVPLSPHGPRT